MSVKHQRPAKSAVVTETLVSSERAFEGRLISLRVDQVELEDGKLARREVVEHRGAVAIVALTADNQVALVEQWRHAAGEALVEIPAGTLDPEEDPAECALRELGEETGFTAGRLDHVVSFWSAPGFTTEKMYLFLARDLKPVQAEADEDERIDAFLVPWQEALAMCADGRIQDAKSIAGILSVQRVLSQDGH